MNKLMLIGVLFTLLVGCQSNTPDTKETDLALPHAEALPDSGLTDADKEKIAAATGKMVKPIMFEDFQKMVKNNKEDYLYIYNFWATWCKPCVEEMPFFERIQSEMKDKVRVIFVSLDNPAILEDQVIPFVREKQIQSEVVLINESMTDTHINAVSKNWEGPIPATLFIQPNKGIRLFHEGELTYEELKAKIQPLIL